MATTLYLEPWRARAFPVVKDLVVDRSAFDRLIAAGGFIGVSTGSAAGRQCHPGSQGKGRPADGRGCVHRLRRMCSHVSECIGVAVHGGQNLASGAVAARRGGARPACGCHGGAGQCRVVRKLHQHGRVRSGLPRRDQDRSHRADEPGLSRANSSPGGWAWKRIKVQKKAAPGPGKGALIPLEIIQNRILVLRGPPGRRSIAIWRNSTE